MSDLEIMVYGARAEKYNQSQNNLKFLWKRYIRKMALNLKL